MSLTSDNSAQNQINIALTSTSEIKKQALESFLKDNYKISTFSVVNDENQCPQPFDRKNGIEACRNRIRWVLRNSVEPCDYVVSIENYIELAEETDYAVVIIYKVAESTEYIGFSEGVKLPDAPNSCF